MSWSIEEHIGDFRPFPAQVVVYKGETGECLAYVSGEVADKLRAENAKLREQVDAAHMSRLLTENENESLRELVRDMMQAWWACDDEKCPRHDERCEEGQYCAFDECVKELGVEVDE